MANHEGVLIGNPSDEGTRIIAVSNAPKLLGELFDGVSINANGSIRVGSVDVHPNEMGPALAEFTRYVNDSLEKLDDKPLNPNRSMVLYTFNGPQKEKLDTEFETFTNWIYTAKENVGMRITILEEIIKLMRTSKIQSK